MSRDRLVRLPSSGKRNDRNAFLKLLYRVRARSMTAWDWEGVILRPGRTVQEAELHPAPHYPADPILIEWVTSPLSRGRPGGGRALHILWRYESGEWRQLGSVEGRGCDGSWALHLAPLAISALQEQGANLPAVLANLPKIQLQIATYLDRVLDPLEDCDRAHVLTVVHDELAARIAGAQQQHPWDLIEK